MGRDTRIEWVDHTFNPWIGCTRVASGHRPSACDNCYAAAMSHRRGWARFEHGAPRRRTTATYWRQPLAWNRKAAAAGRRARVFGPSLADPFDAEVPDDWRRDYLSVIEATPWLGLGTRTGVPRDIVRKLADRAGTALAAPEVAKRMVSIGIEPRLMTPEEFTDYIKAETAKYADVIKRSGAKAE